MRKHLLWFVLGGAACASSTPAPETGATSSQTFAVAGMPGKLTVTSSSRASVSAMTFAVDDVWRVLPAAFDSLGLKVSVMDKAQRVIGIEGLKVRVQLGRTPLSRYMDCGQTQIGPNADSYDVLLSVVTTVQAVATGGSSITTNFDAAAKPIAFSQAFSRCSSRGLFESRLVDLVKRQLQRQGA